MDGSDFDDGDIDDTEVEEAQAALSKLLKESRATRVVQEDLRYGGEPEVCHAVRELGAAGARRGALARRDGRSG